MASKLFKFCVWRAPFALMAGAAFLLSACGGGGGGGSNSGQEPDPVVVDLPLAYVQRPIPLDEDGNPVYPDVFDPREFNPGGELFIKDRATVQAKAVNVTAGVFADDPNFTPDTPNYDVKDVAASLDGKKLVFAMRAPEDPDLGEDEQPTWNIWLYELESKTLRRVISSNFEAEKGDDLSPHFLPDGRILFASNRQKRSREILLDEGKPQFSAVNERDGDIAAFELHVMKDDGTDIEQISFNQSHDYQPSLLADGRILYVRWDGFGANQLSFYTANPDGTNVQPYFGAVSLNQDDANLDEPARLFKPQPLPDGRIAAIYMFNQTSLGGDMVVFDGTAEAEGNLSSISIKPVDITPDLVSLHGRFASLAPLFDGTNRLLVSWSQCRLLETATQVLRPCLPTLLVDGVPAEGYEEAPSLYGIWIYDMTSQTQLPVVLGEDGKLFSEAVALEDFANPPAYIAPTTDPDLAKQNVGILDIRSVYDLDGGFNAMGSGAADLTALAQLPPSSRPARFVRIVKAVSVPDGDTLDEQDDNVFGNLIGQVNGLQEILGYAPVEPDGSVHVKVPADVAFTLEILDGNGRQISRNHTNWLTLRPGETRSCNGCHDPQNTEVVHGRQDLEPAALNLGGLYTGALRVDKFGTPDVILPGETMAQFASRSWFTVPAEALPRVLPECSSGAQSCQSDDLIRKLSVDLDFTDEWTGSTSYSEKNATNQLWFYNNLIPGETTVENIPAPTPVGCRTDGIGGNPWNANCRIVINYEYHIQPLWERERAVMTNGVVTATNCIGCHSSKDIDGNAQIPLGQLDLTSVKQAANAEEESYRQLTEGNRRLIQRNYDGAIATLLPVCEFEDNYDFIPACVVTLDANNVPTCAGVVDCQFEILDELTGALVLDESGNPVPLEEPTGALPPPMSRAGANSSNRFFDRFLPDWDMAENYVVGAKVYYDSVPGDDQPGWIFQAAVANTGVSPNPNQTTNTWVRLRTRAYDGEILSDSVDHSGALNPAELKLLSEWLDTNGQYYANPFELAIPN